MPKPKRYFTLLLLIIPLLITSCKERPSAAAIQDLMEADLDFSEYSVSHGMNAAFLEFADSSAVLLRPDSRPVEGIASIAHVLHRTDDSKFNLRWEPKGADISSSGDLGYTYGIYLLSSGQERQKGTYVTIWKKNAEGQWKFVLDSGNAGLGEE